MSKKIEDLVFEREVNGFRIGDLVVGTTRSGVSMVGRIEKLDLDCPQGLHYFVRGFKLSEMAWCFSAQKLDNPID